MKRSDFASTQTDVSPSLLNLIIKSFLSLRSPTNSDISRECCASLTSTAKVMKALTDCNFAVTHTLSSVYGSKASKHYCLCPAVSALILDISSQDISASLVNCDGEIIYRNEQFYTPQLSFSESLEIFLSRCNFEISKLSCGVGSICVIYNDKTDYTADLTEIEESVSSIFVQSPLTFLSLSQAVSAAVKFNACPLSPNKDTVAYIYFGNEISAICIPYEYPPVHCKIGNILAEDQISIDSLYRSAVSSADHLKILSKIINALDSTLSPTLYFIESDRIKFSPVTEKNLRLTLFGGNVDQPKIRFVSGNKTIPVLGASKETSFRLIRKYIRANNEPNCLKF